MNEKTEVLEQNHTNAFVEGGPIPTTYVKPSVELVGDHYVIDQSFYVKDALFKILKRNIQKNVNTMLLGPTGVGKTEVVDAICRALGKPLTIFDMGTMADPVMSLVGTHIMRVSDGKAVSSFSKSRFSELIQEPGVILLDELNRAPANANNLLFPCLDFRRELPMEYCFEDKNPIKIHPDCVFIATCNTGSQYTGTHKLDKALENRFFMLQVDNLATPQTMTVLGHLYPKLMRNEIEMIVGTYVKINNLHKDFTIGFNLSMRHLKMISAMVVDGFTIFDSFYAICLGIGGEEGVKGIAELLKGTRQGAA